MGKSFQKSRVGIVQRKADGVVVERLHTQRRSIQLTAEYLLTVFDGRKHRSKGRGVDAVKDALKSKDKVMCGDRRVLLVVPYHPIHQEKGVDLLVVGNLIALDGAIGQLAGGLLAHQSFHHIVDDQLFVFFAGKLRVQAFDSVGDVVADQRGTFPTAAQQQAQCQQQAQDTQTFLLNTQGRTLSFLSFGDRTCFTKYCRPMCKMCRTVYFSLSCEENKCNSNIMKLSLL